MSSYQLFPKRSKQMDRCGMEQNNKTNTAGWGIGATYKQSVVGGSVTTTEGESGNTNTTPEKDRDWSQSNIYVHLLGEWALLPCYCVIALLGAALGG